MLFIVFEAGVGRYALAASQVAEVLPPVTWAPVAGAPAGVAGIFNYHGTPVPLVDAAELLRGAGEAPVLRDPAAAPRMRARILVLPSGGTGDGARAPLVGVLVDRVVGTARHEPHEFAERGPVETGAPYLGPVLTTGGDVVQRIEPAHLLPEAARRDVLARWGDVA